MKNYQRPEAEVIAITTNENIASDIPDGEMGVMSNNLFD